VERLESELVPPLSVFTFYVLSEIGIIFPLAGIILQRAEIE
jgi:hypothetical protein